MIGQKSSNYNKIDDWAKINDIIIKSFNTYADKLIEFLQNKNFLIPVFFKILKNKDIKAIALDFKIF